MKEMLSDAIRGLPQLAQWQRWGPALITMLGAVVFCCTLAIMARHGSASPTASIVFCTAYVVFIHVRGYKARRELTVSRARYAALERRYATLAGGKAEGGNGDEADTR